MSTTTEIRPPAEQQKTRNSVGMIALIAAIVGAVFAVIPGALVVGWILLPISFVLAIISLFMKDKKRGQGIAALVISIIGTVVGFLVFFAVVASSVDEAFNEDLQVETPTDSGGQENRVNDDVPVETEEEAETSEEEGTRDNPLTLGTTVSNADWDVTVNSVNLNATDAIQAENPFNEEPAEGHVYILAEVTATYTGSDPAGETPYVSVEYVSPGGNSFASYDAMVVTPNDFDSLETLYEGAATTGNIVMEVPQDDLAGGTLRVSPSIFGDAVFFAIE